MKFSEYLPLHDGTGAVDFGPDRLIRFQDNQFNVFLHLATGSI